MNINIRKLVLILSLCISIAASSCSQANSPATSQPTTSNPALTTTMPSPTSTASPPTSTPPPITSLPPTTTILSVTNGRNIFLNGASLSGDPLYPTNGIGMMYYSCASCHGQNGHGGNIFLMMQVFQVPDITWPALTGLHTDHAPYTVETVKTAITRGLDPAGKPLEYPMPVWIISDRDLHDLLAFM